MYIRSMLCIASIVLLMSACSDDDEDSPNSGSYNKAIKVKRNDSNANHGYNELADTEHRPVYGISEYNTDNPDAKQIEPPKTSIIHSSKFDTALLFGIWAKNLKGPSADFKFSKRSFYIVDYDGDGGMPYDLRNSHLKIYYSTFIEEGDIIAVSKDTLKIKWADINKVTTYLKWGK